MENVITESNFSSRGDAIIDGTISCTKLSQNAISRDNENNLFLDYTQLHSYEIRVIQEQQKEIKDLKQRLEVLENLVLQLTNREI